VYEINVSDVNMTKISGAKPGYLRLKTIDLNTKTEASSKQFDTETNYK